MEQQPTTTSFPWSECAERIAALCAQGPFELADDGQSFLRPGLRVRLPSVLSPPEPERARTEETAQDIAKRQLARRRGEEQGCALAAALKRLPAKPGKQALILMQAGAVSLGYFEGGEALATKSTKRYVVRGNGRAQPTYLATKGKSRYGARLRLQNARRLMQETSEKLNQYWTEFGIPEHVFVGAPKRLWAQFLETTQPKPPLPKDPPVIRIPLDLPVPTTEVLLRAYKSLCYGRVEAHVP